MTEFVAYIDEAGDEGFGKLAAGPVGGQSRWLVIGACIVSRENDLKLPALRDRILNRFVMRDGREVNKPIRSINWNVLNIDNIAVENHSKWAGLQIADCVTSAFFLAVEPNVYGNYEPSYAQLLKGRVLRAKGGSALNRGVTPVPSFLKCRADEAQLAFFKSFVS